MEEINWVEIFEELDIEDEISPDAYRVNSIGEKEYYFSHASYKSTLELLLAFKKDIWLL